LTTTRGTGLSDGSNPSNPKRNGELGRNTGLDLLETSIIMTRRFHEVATAGPWKWKILTRILEEVAGLNLVKELEASELRFGLHFMCVDP